MSTSITKRTAFVRPVGGKRYVHVVNCDYIKGWNIEGCEPLERFNPKKHVVCPTCEALVYLASGAKDYLENKDKYKNMVKRFHLDAKTIYNLIFVARASVQLYGERLYVRKKNDTFYIDFALDEVRLFHNNYNRTERDRDASACGGGFHEHPLYNRSIEAAPGKVFKEAINQIVKYEYEGAKQTHAKRKKPRITFDELDDEFWGFETVK